MTLAKIAAVVVLPTLTMIAQLLFRSALSERDFGFDPTTLFRLFTHPHLMLGVLVQGTGFVAWLGIISQLKLAEAFGMVGAVFYIVVAIVAWVTLGETLSAVQIAGLLAISVGVAALALG